MTANIPESQNEGLAPCPKKPNCVSSDAPVDSIYYIAPLQFSGKPADAWQQLLKMAEEMPRTRIVQETTTFLHLEVRSRIFGFVDDVTFQLRENEKIIALRSASRMGWSDFGANRKRLEQIRQLFMQTD